MAEAQDAAAVDSGVSELTSEYFPSAEPSTAEQPESTSQEPTQEQPEQQTATEESAQAPTQPPVQKYTVNGKEYTAEELQAAITSAQQLPNQSRAYAQLQQQLLQAQQQIIQAQHPQQPQQAQRGGVSVDQIKAMYAPAIKNAVANGMIEADAAEAFPALTSQLFYAYDQLADAREATKHLINRLNAIEQGSTENAVVGEIRSSIASLAGNGEAFAPLATPEAQNQFFEYLVNINPQVGQLRNPEFLKQQWFAFNAGPISEQLAAQRQQAAATQAAKQQARTLARADGAGTRPGQSAPQEVPGHLDMISDLYPRLVSQR